MTTSLFYLPSVGSRADIEAGMVSVSDKRPGDGVAYLRTVERWQTQVLPRLGLV